MAKQRILIFLKIDNFKISKIPKCGHTNSHLIHAAPTNFLVKILLMLRREGMEHPQSHLAALILIPNRHDTLGPNQFFVLETPAGWDVSF
jgi:hypothetical protein